MVTATGATKLLLRKKEYRNLTQSKELAQANADAINEIDFTFNAIE